MQIIVAYVASLVLYPLLDGVWLSFIAKQFYFDQIGNLLITTPNVLIGVFFYLLFGIGLSLFAVAPALMKKDMRYAGIYGALFGFFTYMTYDLTNWATLTSWTATLTYVDVVWGTFASATVALLSYWIARRVRK